VDLKFVEEAVERSGRGKENRGKEKVLELLQAVQGHYGYLPTEALERICELTEITPASIAGVSSFTLSTYALGRPATSKGPTRYMMLFCGILVFRKGRIRIRSGFSRLSGSRAWGAALLRLRFRSAR